VPSRHLRMEPNSGVGEEGYVRKQGKWGIFWRGLPIAREHAKAQKLMLDEFCRNPGYNRKYAIRRLNRPSPGKEAERPAGKATPLG
jgi:hypothetical protein